MRIVFISLFLCYFINAKSQTLFQYAAAKTGISLRESPSVSSKVLLKINYGEKVVVIENNEEPIKISTEGFDGYWQKVKYSNQEGYVVSSYLLPVSPPKTSIKTLKEYLAQISTPVGVPVFVKKGIGNNISDNYFELKKQLYKNGAEWHEFTGYEFSSETFYLPEFTMEQAFLLVRILGCYATEISSNDFYPQKDISTKLQYGDRVTSLERFKFDDGNLGMVTKIKIETPKAAFLLYKYI